MFIFSRLRRGLLRFPMRLDHGATAVEYGLVIGLIAAVIVGAVTALGLGVLGLFNTMPPGL
jgi:pilus assembly protein Flp/PilA